MRDTDECISLQESPDGSTPSDSLESPTTSQSPRGLARASPSPSREREKGSTTSGTSGQSSSGSSRSQDLCSYLASRLESALDANGSLEYRLTSSRQAIPSGLRIFRLLASAHRTSARGSIGEPHGWAPPSMRDWKDSGPAFENDPSIVEEGSRLPRQAALVLNGYPSPTVQDSTGRKYTYDHGNHDKPCLTLPGVVDLTGWGTPRVTTNDGIPCPNSTGNGSRLEDQAGTVLSGWASPASHEAGGTPEHEVSGPTTTSHTSPTEKRGALNPALSRWLMGYHVEWDTAAILAHRSMSTARPKRGSCASRDTGTRSSRNSRQSSSAASSEPSATCLTLTDEFQFEW